MSASALRHFRTKSRIVRIPRRHNSNVFVKAFEYEGKAWGIFVDMVGFPNFFKRYGARWMARLGLNTAYAESPNLPPEVLEANHRKTMRWCYAFAALVGTGFALLPFGFYWLHKRKVRWSIAHTETINTLLDEGLQKAPDGRIRVIDDITNQLENLVALGGTLNQDKYDEMIQTVHTVRANKVLKRAWRKAKLGDVGECAKLLKEVWDSKQITEVGISSEELEAVMLSAHQNYLKALIRQVKETQVIAEAWKLVGNIRGYANRYKLELDDEGLDRLWKRKIKELAQDRRSQHALNPNLVHGQMRGAVPQMG